MLAGDMDGGVDDQGQHSTSVLVHRVRDWTEWNTEKYGGANGSSGAQQIPPLAGGSQERFVDQRRYANISRCVSPAFTPMSAPHFYQRDERRSSSTEVFPNSEGVATLRMSTLWDVGC